MSSSEFKPGLEGVVAVETEIMEPDREGGTLRYRGVDVEPLIGEYPYENIWGLLVDDDIRSRMPLPEPFEPVGITGRRRPISRRKRRGCRGLWGLGQAERDLRRPGPRGPRPHLRPDDVDRRPVGAAGRRT